MNFANTVEYLKTLPIPQNFLTKAKGNTFVCVGCGNGEGVDRTGAKLSDDETRLLCGKCSKGFSYIDVAAAYYNIDLSNFVEGVKQLCKVAGIEIDEMHVAQEVKTVKKEKSLPTELRQLIAEDIENGKANLVKLPTAEKRGLTDETLADFQIGVIFDWKPPQNRLDNEKSYPSPRVIIPHLINPALPNIPLTYCAALFLGERERIEKQGNKSAKYLYGGSRTPFGLNTLKAAEELLVTEGEIDALSIWQATSGKYPCLATGGTANNGVIDTLKQFYTGKKPTIYFVADNDNAGKNFAETFCNAAKEAGFIATPICFAQPDAPKLDANKILVEQGNAKLAESIQALIAVAQIEVEKAVAAERKALFGQNAAEYFEESFFSELEVRKQFAERNTGYENLDDEMQGILPGLYTFGALPALGKTTFLLQLLAQMAQKGNTCIYCSYEMSIHTLYCKIAARETYRIESKDFSDKPEHVLSATNILKGKFYEHRANFDAALIKVKQQLSTFRVWQMATQNVDDLISRLEKICAKLEKPPVVCIDYIQLLTVGSENVKNALDASLLKLKNFQEKTKTTLFLISSLNRANYTTEIAFESFKESGGLEYFSDCIFGMQFLLEDKNGAKLPRTQENVEAAKKENPRKIQLKCLKNRFGANFDIGFFYYPAVDLFLPMLEYGDYTDHITKQNGETVKVKKGARNGKKR